MPGGLPNSLVVAAVALVVAAIVVWVVTSHRKQRQAREPLLARIGFRPCPEEKDALEAIVARITNDRDNSYVVEQPRRRAGEPPVYYYVRVREGDADEQRDAGEELLFRVRRRATAGVVLIVKPSNVAPGLATRMLSAVATGPWGTQPDDLKPLELPPNLGDTNLLGALGPPGARLYDLIDSKTLSVVQGLGDAGGLTIRLRDEWCAVESGHYQIPFRIDEILTRVRPLF